LTETDTVELILRLLQERGADQVLRPFAPAADQAAGALTRRED
jgi:hypothetical protein